MSYKVLLGVTGSVAARLIPKFYDMLRASHCEVKVILTEKSKYFIPNTFMHDAVYNIYDDSSEWVNGKYTKDDPVLHVDLATENDLLMIVPATANTLGKIANGICDNLLTCLVRAWPREKDLVIAPAMNTVMWNNPLTQKNLDTIRELYPSCYLFQPQVKKLACGAEGMGALADLNYIADLVRRLASYKEGW